MTEPKISDLTKGYPDASKAQKLDLKIAEKQAALYDIEANEIAGDPVDQEAKRKLTESLSALLTARSQLSVGD